MSSLDYPELPVMIIDDEENFLLSAGFTLSSNGINNVLQCQDSAKVMDILRATPVSAIALDMTMPVMSGWDLLPIIVREFPEVPVIVITAVNEVETAVECMKAGAFDYIVKPVDDSRLVTAIQRALELRQVIAENIKLKQYLLSGKLEHPEAFKRMVTKSNAMHSIFQYIEAIAGTSLPVLITGETGAGKELIARAIHDLSGRKGEFVAVNVAGLDDNLFSDSLFGHKKGAFTGADKDRKGLIEQASRGTLFLDEIGDLSMESQVKLLRLLQEKQYYPIGSDVPKLTDARIVVATLKDIEKMSATDHFRKDLYYRLKAHNVHIPPLRQRKEDIPLLVNYFLERAAAELNKKRPTPPRELFTLLNNYDFPGNIRELEGMIFDAVSRHQSGVLSIETFREIITPKALPGLSADANSAEPTGLHPLVFPYPLPTLKETENTLIAEALKRADGNQTIAAHMLGLTRRALNNRLHRSKD
ncbi:MAG TPA: sigma-54 dependent transcriptional regulator [bacterium]|nr:sigma-54 dependent transcriptional regulator [bacterium]HPN43855.1 sigma-54 dependent transcriptional regulator [bacterium]